MKSGEKEIESVLSCREDCASDCIQAHLGSLSESKGWHRCHCIQVMMCKKERSQLSYKHWQLERTTLVPAK